MRLTAQFMDNRRLCGSLLSRSAFLSWLSPLTLALQNVRVIDGTGGPIRMNQRVIISSVIATRNGAKFLGQEDRIGSIAVGQQADLFVVSGNPAVRLADIKNVKIVFKDGVGYDSAKRIESVRGTVGVHSLRAS